MIQYPMTVSPTRLSAKDDFTTVDKRLSKISRTIVLFAGALFLILQTFNNSPAQDIEASLTISLSPVPKVTVDGKFGGTGPRVVRNLGFLREYAGTTGLAVRIHDLNARSADGSAIPIRELVAGEFVADADISSWSYEINAATSGPPSSRAHLTWIGDDRGVLRLDDLLPQMAGDGPVAARITIVPPRGWDIHTTEVSSTENTFEVRDIENAVLIIAMSGSARLMGDGREGPRFNIFDEWTFDDSEASEMADAIYRGYRDIFGSSPAGRQQITLMRLPKGTPFGTWEADTRGGNVLILSADMPFKTQGVQRLHEQLRHEIFHLWIPGAVNLSGRYDWFYEGFALYTALKAGVAVNQLRFEDYLSALARAYDAERADARSLSLIDAAKGRWAGANTRVYARGMIVAFLCDVAMLARSKGKVSTADILRDVYSTHGPRAKRVDGNTAILAILRKRPELVSIVDRYITGSQPVDWSAQLALAGIEAADTNGRTKLSVVSRPGGRQKDLLDRLGYNNWRKLAGSKK